MTPSFSPFLVNDKFGDPGLFIGIRWSRRALLFDLGDTAPLSPTQLLRVQDIFVSHTHMDHFIGFDRLLRVALGRGKHLRFYGPPGLIHNIQGKLHGYTWNLVDGYPLVITVKEFHPSEIHVTDFYAQEGFIGRSHPPISADHSGTFTLLQEPGLTVKGVSLNHRIPSFAFMVEEPFHINVNKVKLHEAGLPVGSWLKEVKQKIWEGQPDSHTVTATLYFEHREEQQTFRLGDLKTQFMTMTPGQKVGYVVDCLYDAHNEAKIVSLCKNINTFYCEAPFLDQDREKAAQRYHLTAKQAGRLGRQAGAKELIVFHFSPRYTGLENQLHEEARREFLNSDPVED